MFISTTYNKNLKILKIHIFTPDYKKLHIGNWIYKLMSQNLQYLETNGKVTVLIILFRFEIIKMLYCNIVSSKYVCEKFIYFLIIKIHIHTIQKITHQQNENLKHVSNEL